MRRAIYEDDVIKLLDKGWKSGVYPVASNIHALPPAQPARKTGKWEIYIISMIDGEGCRCSECGFEGAPYWDYCPNCGSYNGGEQDGER